MYTPFYAVEPIIKYLPMDKIIWLPFDDEWSAFNQLLTEMGYKVVRSSINDGQDFFTYEPADWDIIVSNPPFSKKDAVLKRLYQFNKPFAVLLPTNSLQGKKRYQLFKQGIQLLSFDGRIGYHTEDDFSSPAKSSPFSSSYFCRDILPKDIILEKLTLYDRPLKEVINGKTNKIEGN